MGLGGEGQKISTASLNFSSNCSVRMEAPCARAREASHAHGRKNLKSKFPRGLWGVPQYFFTPNLIFFVTLNSVQNFKTVAHTLLGEKFVWVVGGGWWWWLRVNLVLRFGPNLRLRLWIWTWTKLNNIFPKFRWESKRL